MSKVVQWNNYMIDRKFIGKGSFAKVYRGVSKKTNQEVAVKKISFGDLPKKIKSRTMIEIDILKSLNHDNVIKLYDYKFEKDNLFIITEYCNQGDLFNWINKNKSPDEIFDKVKQIVDGINYLHTNRIIHRDIKPQNILLHNSNIKICDFGFSQTIKEELSMLKTICGTPLYMSPEVINLQNYTIKSEIWSLGILLYQIFFNKHPYGRPSNIQEYKMKLLKEPKLKEITLFKDQILNDIFNDLILKMLSINPESRPSIEQILNEINKGIPEEDPDTFFLGDSKLDFESNNADIWFSHPFIDSRSLSINDSQSTETNSQIIYSVDLEDESDNLVLSDDSINYIENEPENKTVNRDIHIPSSEPIQINKNTITFNPNSSSSFINSPNQGYLEKICNTESKINLMSPHNTIIIDDYFDKMNEEKSHHYIQNYTNIKHKIPIPASCPKFVVEQVNQPKGWISTIYNYVGSFSLK